MNSGNKNLARKAVAVVVMVTFLDLVGPTGTDLLPVSTSTRIPIVVR